MKKDLKTALILGFLIGVFFLPTIAFHISITIPISILIIVACVISTPILLIFFKFCGNYIKSLEQFGKFAAVGTLNSAIDIGVLNILMFLTGFNEGVFYAIFKSGSFFVSKINSYFWNKFWTFESTTKISFKEYLSFAFYTLVGAVINTSAASFVVNYVKYKINLGITDSLWGVLGAVAGILASFLWNFLSYRKIVFKT